MALFLSIFPIVLLIWLMVKKNSVPSYIALPVTAVLIYIIQMFYFNSPTLALNANVAAGLVATLTPITVIFGAIMFNRMMETTGCIDVIRKWLATISPNPRGRATGSSGQERSGWYYDLPDKGERIVYGSTYIPMSTMVMFNSLIPNAASAVGVCGVSGGGGNTYQVDLFSARGNVTRSRVGIPGQPLVLSNEPGTTETTADSTGRRIRSRPLVVVTPGADGISAQQAKTDLVLPVGRLSWRQINNYQELRKK